MSIANLNITPADLRAILWATIEDDAELWALVWELNSLYPDTPAAAQREKVKNILTRLFEDGMICFYYGHWGEDTVENITDPLPLLNDQASWELSSVGEQCIKIGSTEKGEAWYNMKT